MPEKIRGLVTADDVARLAGVSRSAVSRAFTEGASIAPQTRTRILSAAAQLGYHPNQIARSLTSGRSNIIGLGVSNLRNPFYSESLEALSVSLELAGYRVLLFPLENRAGGALSIGEALHYRLEALILLSVTLSSTLVEECRHAGVPVILYNRTTLEPAVSTITGTNEAGARIIAAHLLACGHDRLAFIAGGEDASTSQERERGFLTYLAEQGASPPLRENGLFDFEAAAAATRRLLARKDAPDAIFCANDLMAIAAINVARHEFGLEVGREVSIVGFDDVAMASWPAFSLTTFAQPTAEMAGRTLDAVRFLRDNPGEARHYVAEGRLFVRSSTRPIPKRS